MAALLPAHNPRGDPERLLIGAGMNDANEVKSSGFVEQLAKRMKSPLLTGADFT